MHKFFPSWYKALTIQATQEELEARWSLVGAIVDNLTNGAALAIAGLAFKDLSVRPNSMEFLEGSIREADPAFPLKDNEVELRLLATVAATHLLEGEESSPQADVAALAVESCVFRKWSPVLQELVSASAAYLTSESVRAREVPRSPSDIKPNGTAKPLKVLKDAIEQNAPTWPMVGEALSAIASEIRNLQKYAASLAESSTTESLAEELNVVWWLMGEFSTYADRPFTELGKAASLILAKEIASLTSILPELPQGRAFLSKALSLSKATASISVSDAVLSVPGELKQGLLPDLELEIAKDFLPVTIAITRALEVEDSDTWIEPTSKVVGFDLKTKLGAVDLSVQFYRENMLGRALTNE